MRCYNLGIFKNGDIIRKWKNKTIQYFVLKINETCFEAVNDKEFNTFYKNCIIGDTLTVRGKINYDKIPVIIDETRPFLIWKSKVV